ncbi:hypothetical protein AY600_17085 [Phormidium willei BDU 130791]|nr:hypothetical protein AY600_17085 [Phormidium willei BDU 130791]
MSHPSLNAVYQHLQQWIEEFLSVGHPHFAGLSPCPFSRQAWIEHRVHVQPCQGDDLEAQLLQIAQNWCDRHDVYILANLGDHPLPNLEQRVDALNYQLGQNDVVALVDSPHNPATSLSHTNTSNQKYVLILLQRLSHLQAASRKLAQTGYYDNWTAVDFRNLVDWRSKLLPRQEDEAETNPFP